MRRSEESGWKDRERGVFGLAWEEVSNEAGEAKFGFLMLSWPPAGDVVPGDRRAEPGSRARTYFSPCDPKA